MSAKGAKKSTKPRPKQSPGLEELERRKPKSVEKDRKIPKLKLKQLELYLEQLDGFKQPKIELEQYPTSAHIAAQMLHEIQAGYGDIDGKHVLDLGCGCGVLAIGAVMLGATACTAVDIDEDALEICRKNLDSFDISDVHLVQADVRSLPNCLQTALYDTVIMNPPFGTRDEGIDMVFLKAGLDLTSNAVYSLHKTSTRRHIERKAKEWDADFTVVLEVRYNLPKSYKFHKHETVDIEVDFIRLSKKKTKKKEKQSDKKDTEKEDSVRKDSEKEDSGRKDFEKESDKKDTEKEEECATKDTEKEGECHIKDTEKEECHIKDTEKEEECDTKGTGKEVDDKKGTEKEEGDKKTLKKKKNGDKKDTEKEKECDTKDTEKEEER